MKILPAEPIIPQQKTPPHRAVHHMHNRNLIRRKHLDTRYPSNLLTSTIHSSTSWIPSESTQSRSTCRQKCCVPGDRVSLTVPSGLTIDMSVRTILHHQATRHGNRSSKTTEFNNAKQPSSQAAKQPSSQAAKSFAILGCLS